MSAAADSPAIPVRVGPFCCYATGLGLVAYDAAAGAELEEGPGFGHPLGRSSDKVEAALAAGRAVMLTTGQAQMDYLVQVFFEPAPEGAPETLVMAADFALSLPSGELCLRDAYELMDWETAPLHVIRVLVPPDDYYVQLWRLQEPNGLCVLHLHLIPGAAVEGGLPAPAGWVDLFD